MAPAKPVSIRWLLWQRYMLDTADVGQICRIRTEAWYQTFLRGEV